MDIVREQVRFESAVEFLQIPTRRPTKLVGTIPNVFGNEFWIANTNGTITNFTKGAEGQQLNILGDGSTIISNNAFIKTNTGANKTLTASVVYTFTLYNNVWYESTSSGGGGGSVAGADTEVQYNNGGVLAANPNFVYKISSGYGLKVGTNDDSKYGLKIADAAQLGYFTAYGKQIVSIGQEMGTLLTSLLNPAYAGTALIITADNARNGGDNDASIYLMNGASGGFNAMASQILAGGDQGLRIHYNLIHDATGFHASDTTVCSNQLSFETDGAMGLEYTKPAVIAPGPYDALPGKAFKLHPAGNPALGVIKDKYILLTSGEPGRGFDLGVETGGTGSAYGTRIRIDDSSVADPIYLYIAGALRQVHAFNDGLGHNVLYY
jgi:hypothetical protein